MTDSILYLPDQWKPWLFGRFVSAMRSSIPEWLRSLLTNMSFGIREPKRADPLLGNMFLEARKAGLAAAILTLVFSLGGTLLTTYLAGTLHGEAPERIYFTQDKTNLINFTLVCPAYVGFAIAFFALVLRSWQTLDTNSLLLPPSPRRTLRIPIWAWIILVLSSGAALIINFMVNERLNPRVVLKAGWWVDILTTDNVRILRIAGIYYILLLYSLLLICLATGVLFFVHVLTGAEVARALRSRTDLIAFKTLQDSLGHFTHSYIVAKAFVACLIVNMYTWRWELSNPSVNFQFMTVVLATVGLVFVSFPRYWVELEWYQYKVRYAIEHSLEIPLQSDDLRHKFTGLCAAALDGLFFLSFLVFAYENVGKQYFDTLLHFFTGH